MIMRWLPHAFVCSIFLASEDFFVKLASNKISLHAQVMACTVLVKTSLLLDEFERHTG